LSVRKANACPVIMGAVLNFHAKKPIVKIPAAADTANTAVPVRLNERYAVPALSSLSSDFNTSAVPAVAAAPSVRSGADLPQAQIRQQLNITDNTFFISLFL